MGRKQKKTPTEGGQSGSEGAQASPGAKDAAGTGGKSNNPSSDDSPRPDAQKAKKTQKQAAVIAGGQESGKVKRKTNDRDSSEDAKKQGAKQKAKSSRGGSASAKSSEAKGGCCSVWCCLALLSVLVAVVAVAGYAAFITYPDESIEFIETADIELKQIYRKVRDVTALKLDELLVAIGQKTTPDETASDQKTSEEEDGNRWKDESKEDEDDFNEESVTREHVSEDEDSEETVIRRHAREDEDSEEEVVKKHVAEDEAYEETVVRKHVPEAEAYRETVPEDDEEKEEVEDKVEEQTRSGLDERVGDVDAADGKSEDELDEEGAEEERTERESEERTSEGESVDEDGASEEEGAEDDEVEADDSRDDGGKHWEVEEEERVGEEPENPTESPAGESIETEELTRDDVDAAQAAEPEQVEQVSVDVPIVEEHQVPKQEVPEPEVAHVDAPEPEVAHHVDAPEPEAPRVVVSAGEVLEPQVLDVGEVDLGVREDNSLAEERPGETVQVESEEPVATEHLDAQLEEPAKTEVLEEPVAFEAAGDAVNRDAIERGHERGDRGEAVEDVQADVPVSGSVPVDVGTVEEQVHRPIPPVAETEYQEQLLSPVLEHSVESAEAQQPTETQQPAETQQSAETQQPAELNAQQDAPQEQQEVERFESNEEAGETSDKKSAEELESELDELEGIVNMAPKDAIEMYNRILDVVPENPRAVIGKAYALGVVANAEQNDALLEQSINEYLKVFALPSVPKHLMVTAARACAEKQTHRGWVNAASQTLKSLVAMYPDDLALYNELGQKYLITGAYEDARATFKEILSQDPNDGFARLYLGYIMKLVDKELERSLGLMKSGLVTVPITDLNFYIELGESLTRVGRHDEAHEVYQLAVDRKVLKSIWQRSWYNIDGLRSQPWWTIEQTNNLINLQVLEDFSTAIGDEVLEILSNRSDLFQPDARDVIESGEMKHMKLFVNGGKVTENCDAAVKTCSLLDAFSDATECQQCEIKFSLIQPGSHTRPHCGPTNCRVTAHVPLIIDPQTKLRVADQTRTYVPHKVLIFDDSFEQELWVASDSLQLLLTVEMWHPDLSAELRKTLGPL